MKSYISNLNEREKWMVLSATLCVLVYVYYFFLYAPIASRVEERQQQFIEKTETLQWMNKVKNQKTTTSVKKTIDNGQLLTLLSTQLKNHATIKFPFQLQQTSSGETQINFDQVPFNLFIEWLAQLNNKYKINIKQFDINKTPTPGVVQLMIILSAD
ncbi:type II secretion system protein GspM [Legionella sp. km772]|uniref:type II secretion system protein GspM n=1 Tax=Legionella sp. km772 TaxID=2498111 RepID=UPI000F8E3A15|nr:type II secretion system protein GspM [Legionella sp. km772]RUR10290.1 type II secretion system protein M [Legionella sp. km772]